MQRPLYKRIVTAEEKIALRDEAQHRLRANKLRGKAGMQPLGTPAESSMTKAALNDIERRRLRENTRRHGLGTPEETRMRVADINKKDG